MFLHTLFTQNLYDLPADLTLFADYHIQDGGCDVAFETECPLDEEIQFSLRSLSVRSSLNEDLGGEWKTYYLSYPSGGSL